MPIIASTAGAGTPGPSSFLDSRGLFLRTIDGTDQQLFPMFDHQWVIMPGATGLGLPPLEWPTQKTPGMDGAWLRGKPQIGAREVFLPLSIASDDGHTAFLDMKDRLEGLLDYLAVDDPEAEDGTVQLVASSVKGERYLPVVYTGGMEGDEGRDQAGTYWAAYGLKLLAVDPWWRASEETVLEFTKGPEDPFLSLPGAGDLWPRTLGSSITISGGETSPITIGGKVPVWVTVEVDGPATSTIVTGTDMNVELDAVLAGEQLVMSTDPRRRSVRVDDVPAWARVAAAPTFAPLNPGTGNVLVAVTGDDTNTRVRLKFRPSYRSAW